MTSSAEGKGNQVGGVRRRFADFNMLSFNSTMPTGIRQPQRRYQANSHHLQVEATVAPAFLRKRAQHSLLLETVCLSSLSFVFACNCQYRLTITGKCFCVIRMRPDPNLQMGLQEFKGRGFFFCFALLFGFAFCFLGFFLNKGEGD